VNLKLDTFDQYKGEVARLWQASGISPGTVYVYFNWVRRFYGYCKQQRLETTAQLTLIGAKHFGQCYTGPRKNGPVRASSCLVAKNALHAWAFAISVLGVSVPEWSPAQPPIALRNLLSQYSEFRRHHRGVAAGTLKRDIDVAGSFLSLLKSRGKSVSTITAADLDAFVKERTAHHSRRTIATACTALRSFLRFLHSTGRQRRDLASCVIAPRVRIMEQPARVLPWRDVKRILASAQQSKSSGKRDVAMLLMMALYGFGAAEVLALELDDIKWQLGIVALRRPKTGVRVELPLLSPIAKALSAYLQDERPRYVETRRIFLSAVIPHKPLTSGGIRHRIREYAEKAGVAAKVIGAHAFRHTHASRQVDAGANLKVISDILGHRRPSSTSVYVRVALRRLREVTLPVPK
jgi:integrase/recombinase XerD